MKVRGYRAGAVGAAIKYEGRLDLGLIVSDVPAAAAGVFTRNEVKAAPVLLGIERLSKGVPLLRAVVANSGNANACTGPTGLENARRMCELVARAFDLRPDDVLVTSTGVIGEPLPMKRIEAALPALFSSLSEEGLVDFADAVLTTDTFRKTALKTLDAGGVRVTVAGIAKGAGMIGPSMAPPQATMLAYILTDAAVDQAWLQKALSRSADASFNCILVDGDTSTNDTVLALANGIAGNEVISGQSRMASAFESLLTEIMQELAADIVRDGEGATKLVTVTVDGARTKAEAERIARVIAASPLVKTAFFGEDPNWGRILAAAGRAGVPLDQDRLGLRVDDVEIVRNGQYLEKASEIKAHEVMRRKEFQIRLGLGLGEACASVLTCDLSREYVSINADYRT